MDQSIVAVNVSQRAKDQITAQGDQCQEHCGQGQDQRQDFGFESKTAAKRALWDLLSLRNNLAHTHDIVKYDWDTILRLSQRIDRIVTRI